MKIKRFLPFLLVFLIVSACHKRSGTLLKLDYIESIIQPYPDSALKLLREVEPAQLKEGEEKAKYGLLLTMAEDKNYLDPKNDSIISYASEYFTRKGDVLNQIKSDYYRGRVLYHRQDFPAALVSYFKAKDDAGGINEFFWEGMAYRGISDVYLEVSASADELHYAKLEYESFKKSGVQPYLNYALWDLARAYNNDHEDEVCLKLADELTDSALLYEDSNLYIKTVRLKSGIHFWSGNLEEAYPLLEELYESGYGTNVDSLYYILSSLKLKNREVMNEVIDRISDDERPYKEYIRYQIYKEKGDYKNALQQLEALNTSIDKGIRKKGGFNLATNLTGYFEYEKDLKEKQVEIQKYRIWLLFLLSFLIISLMFIIIRKIIKKHKEEINAKILLLDQLEEMLKDSQTQNDESERIIRKLFGNQFSLIEESCEIIYRNPDSKKAKRQVSEYITSLVEDLKIDGKGITNIEKEVDLRFNNIMTDLKREMPNLNKIDYLIFLYSLLGFSANIITYLLNLDKVETVYNRKRHLKDKIKKLGENKSKRYLNYL